MNIKKAIGAGLLVFAIQFSAVSIIGNVAGPFLGSSAWVGYLWQAFMVLLLVAIVYSMARWYFTGNNVSILRGFYLGLMFVAISFAINLLQTLPALAFGQNIWQPLSQYISSIAFWVTVAITLGAAILAGYTSTRRSACNIKEAVTACMPKEDTTQ